MLGRFPTSIFPLFLLGLLAGMTYWLEMASRPPGNSNGAKFRHDPDYVVENFEVRRFGPEGNLQHTMRASLMKHFPDDDSTVIEAPDLTYHRVPPTHITAREGTMDGKGEHVQLYDNVRIARGARGATPETLLLTRSIDAYPDEEIATNAVPVTITQGLSTVSGSSLHADNKTETYILNGPVRGIFHRHKATTVVAPAETGDMAPPPIDKPAAKPQSKPVLQPKPKLKPTTQAKAKSKAKKPTPKVQR